MVYGITLLVTPEYSFSQPKYDGSEGDFFSVSASIAANPAPTDFTWSQNGNELQSTSTLTLTSTSLQIMSLQRMDTGVYSISGSNTVGTGSGQFKLTVFCEFVSILELQYGYKFLS